MTKLKHFYNINFWKCFKSANQTFWIWKDILRLQIRTTAQLKWYFSSLYFKYRNCWWMKLFLRGENVQGSFQWVILLIIYMQYLKYIVCIYSVIQICCTSIIHGTFLFVCWNMELWYCAIMIYSLSSPKALSVTHGYPWRTYISRSLPTSQIWSICL